jgi:hypothetical protein
MSKLIEAVPPHNADKVLQVNLWWTTRYFGHNFGFQALRTRQLWRKGLVRIADLWNQQTCNFRTWPDLQCQFGI